MPDSSGRRISLDPMFEAFDFLDAEPPSQPQGTNGFHVASSYDEEIVLFGGLGSQSIEPDANGGANGAQASVESNGAEPHAESNGAASNGAVSNGAVLNGTVTEGTSSDATASIGAVSNGIATNGELFAHESPAVLPDIADSETTEPAASETDFEVIDLGHDAAVDDPSVHELHAEAELPLLEEPPASDEPIAAEDAAVADTLDSPAAELVDSQPELPEAGVPPSAASTPSDRDAHPAAGSLFVPYLVTEIRELRGRKSRRRSWWRRLFG
jgi:hypothetical protein